MDGFIIIDKPAGVTSFSMVGLVRRVTGVRRVGHAGTLDPLASGVLPVAIGAATRLIEYMEDQEKTYVATVKLGEATDTYDAEGAITERGDASGVTRKEVKAALDSFVGEVEQVPPIYSALKVRGQPLYRYARAGADVTVEARRVRIDSIALLSFAGALLRLEVVCGKGTYIRSLVHDLGQQLGCGAHLAGLVRTRSAGFQLEDAHAPDAVVASVERGKLAELVLAPDRAVEHRPAMVLGEGRKREIGQGRQIEVATSRADALSRAYSTEGEFLGVLEHRAEGVWHPKKMLQSGRKLPE